MSGNRKGQKSCAKLLHDLACIEENRFCFDCDQRGPTYVNMSIGSFVCTRCGGALRQYNQRVKSISMSNFNAQEINFLKRRGNKACGKMYLAVCDGKEPENRNHNFDDYLRLKYQVQQWYCYPDPSVEAEALRDNEAALAHAAQSPVVKVNHISSNAAAGLIILNNRSFPTPPTKRPNSNDVLSEGTLNANVPIASSVAPVPALNELQQQTHPLPTASDKTVEFPDPFAEFVTARPSVAVSEAANPPSLFSQTASVIGPLQQGQSVQPNSSAVLNFPLFSSSLSSATSIFPTSDLSAPASLFVSSAFDPTFPAFDKYAALAELDRIEKTEKYNQLCRPPVTGSVLSPPITMSGPQHERLFCSSTSNPFQPQPFRTNNPFLVMNNHSTSAIQSNTPPAPKTTNSSSSPSQNSFNSFVNAQ